MLLQKVQKFKIQVTAAILPMKFAKDAAGRLMPEIWMKADLYLILQ